ncbi:hypothetical protein PG990_015397 [Apiospora arundinis]
MAEVIGLTASIVSLVDIAIKIVSTGRSLYGSLNDTPDEIGRLSLVIEDIRRRNFPLRQRAVARPHDLCEDEKEAMKLANECDDIVKKLNKIFDKLKIRDGHSRTLEVTRVAFRQLMGKKEVTDLCTQLRLLDKQVRINMNRALQGKSHSATMAEIRAIHQSADHLAINFSSRLEDIQEETILKLSGISKSLEEHDAQTTSLLTKLHSLEIEKVNREKKIRVIESLHFTEINRRWSIIEDADTFTNSWIFDESQTSFMSWLKSGSGMFWIGGKPGSGKSTLMKFAFKDCQTQKALRQWAGSRELHTASYFFWNQGFEMQKSKVGLLQSLLYQILSRAPDLIPDICYDHPAHEQWEFNALRLAFQTITEREDVPTKFCFFIDGLDEYGGDEEDLSHVLSSLSHGPHVKFCVSSRHRPFLENIFQQKEYSLAIEDFTMGDMMAHVRRILSQNKKFRLLENADALLKEMVETIAKHAQGVWLWVYLITRDMAKAVNHDEPSAKLREIMGMFPKDLEAYFERVINKIEQPYRHEMAKIFLITLEEVQPLPLYAFSLLDKEDQNPLYAVEAQMSPITEEELSSVETPWRSRIINRCGDLLTVSPGRHPTFLRNPVDFMHRTVRDFLQDCYLPRLKRELGALKYSPLLSLCNMSLYLLKKLARNDLSRPRLRKDSIRRTIGLVDELLYYAREYEVMEGDSSVLVPILDEVDRVNRVHAGNLRNHWTHARDLPTARGLDEYREGGNCNYLALAVQARLVCYVREKLQAHRTMMKKSGRPLLDYALRPRRVTAIQMPYHSDRDDPSVDVNMVRLLLDFGASPNQQVYLNDGRTVWALFLLSMYETKNRDEDNPDLTGAWYAACDLLVQHGASPDCWLEDAGSTRLTAYLVLEKVFGPEKAQSLTTMMKQMQAQIPKNVTWFSRFRAGFGLLEAPS